MYLAYRYICVNWLILTMLRKHFILFLLCYVSKQINHNTFKSGFYDIHKALENYSNKIPQFILKCDIVLTLRFGKIWKTNLVFHLKYPHKCSGKDFLHIQRVREFLLSRLNPSWVFAKMNYVLQKARYLG